MKPTSTSPVEPADRSVADVISARKSLLTADEVAVFLSIAKTTIYGMCNEGRIPHIRIGSAVRFDPKTTGDWVRKKYASN